MPEDTQTTGTPTPDGGDAASTQTTGTQAGDGRNADTVDGSNINREEALQWKAKAERTNELERELEELKRSRQVPADEPQPQRRGTDWNKVRAFADDGDEVARAQLETAELLLKADVERQLDRIPDPTLRAKTEAHFNQNRHRFADVNGARAEIEAAQLARENEELRKRLDQASKKPPEDTVSTAIREVGATEARTKEMTRAQWTRDQDSLSDTDRMRQQRARRAGTIVVKD